MKKYSVKVNGTEYEVEVEEAGGAPDARPFYGSPAGAAPAAAPAQVAAQPAPRPAAAAPAPKAAQSAPAGSTAIQAPMPGTILKIVAQAGDKVKSGQPILVLEAMKMENDIVSPVDGTVASVNVAQGASVNAGDLLASVS